uniref:P-type ATPase n=1 Tax=Cupriavidus sp. WS TaxID=1312922 RepID=UPI002100A4C3
MKRGPDACGAVPGGAPAAPDAATSGGIPQALLRAARVPAAVLLEELAASPDGLSEDEAARRLQCYGPNQAERQHTRAAALELLLKLLNPLNVLLLVLAIVSASISNFDAAAVIAVMVLLSVGLATVQERRSGRAAAALCAMVHTTAATQRRAGPADPPATRELPIGELVPGDIVHLAAGDLVPADARVLASKDLFVNQAPLTGESLPVEKFALDSTAGTEPGTLENMVLMGTAVVSGSASVVVVLTGPHAMFGGIARSLAEQAPATVFE